MYEAGEFVIFIEKNKRCVVTKVGKYTLKGLYKIQSDDSKGEFWVKESRIKKPGFKQIFNILERSSDE